MESDEGLTPLSEETSKTKFCFSDFADSLCPFYMSIGVPYYEYWNGDYSQLPFYVEAYELKKEHENWLAWLQGAYIYELLCDIAPALQAFPAKGASVKEYRDRPFELKEKQEDEKQEQIKNNPMLIKFQTMASKWNANFNKKRGE